MTIGFAPWTCAAGRVPARARRRQRLAAVAAPAVDGLVHAYPVHVHALREHAACIGAARPAAADGDVEQQEERLVEYPGPARLHLRARDRIELHVVDEPADARRVPLHRIHVVGRVRALAQVVGAGDGRIARIPGPMQRAVGERGLGADVLHDVDLAALPTSAKFPPSIQNAGQMPCVCGRRMRASMRPWRNSCLPRVTMRLELYWQAPYQHVAPAGAPRRASITSTRLPAIASYWMKALRPSV
jgi:hypothetical protein